MSLVDSLVSDANGIFMQQNPDISELQKILTDVQDAISAPTYKALDFPDQNRLMELLDEIKEKIHALEQSGPAHVDDQERHSPDESISSFSSEHSPQVVELMDKAEALFYAIRFPEAISCYDRILEKEPGYERAKQHRADAEKYLREGLPSGALPDEAGIHFGKAQSAVRVKNYAEARVQLNLAIAAVKQAGIPKWNEGREFAEKLDVYEDAEKTYQEGASAFKSGDLDLAIEKAETAFSASLDNRYKGKAEEWRTLQADLASFNQILTSGSPSIKLIADTKSKLDGYLATYGEIRALVRVQTLLQNRLPTIVELIIAERNACKQQAERSPSIDDAISLTKQAQQLVKSLQDLGSTDERLPNLKTDTDQLVRRFQGYEGAFEEARQALDAHPHWPADAWKLSANIRRQFPRDPKVVDLTGRLSIYSTVRNVGIGSLSILGLVILLMVLWMGTRWVTDYIHSLTPTPTLTPTLTQTLTPIPTNTPIPTSTLTPLPTLTPTPTVYTLKRSVYARQDCYDSFTAVGNGMIPSGVRVTPLPVEPHRDNIGRTCLLVEYDTSGGTMTGWVLLQDLQP